MPRTARRALPGLVAILVALALALVPSHAAAAATVTINDATSCTAAGGSMDGSTCVLVVSTPGTDLVTNIPLRLSATVPLSSLGGSGPITLAGSISADGSPLTLSGGLDLGIYTLTKTGPGVFLVSGVVSGPGSVVVAAGYLAINSTSTFLGGVTVQSGGELVLYGPGMVSSAIANSGRVINNGTISGAITNSASGTVTNYGTVSGVVTNVGAFTNHVTLSGAMDNAGTVVNNGAMTGGYSGAGSLTGSGSATPLVAQTVAFSSSAAAVVDGAYSPTYGGSSSGTTDELMVGPSAVCTQSGGLVEFHTIGTCTVTVTRPASAMFSSASDVQTVSVAGLPQTTTISTPAPSGATVGGSLSLAATATSGEAVVFSSLTPSVCTVTGTTVGYVAAGACQVVADQGGTSRYAAAPRVTLSFAIVAAPAGGGSAAAGLAATGAAPLGGVLAGIAALVAGAALVLGVRIRSAARS